MPESVLMIAFHFPPYTEVSGALRTLSMAEELVEAGYKPIIMAPKPLAYPNLISTLSRVDDVCETHRTFALDAARHMGLFGRYPEFLAQPDRWVSWWLSAVPRGLSLIRRHKPKIIWSTYPIATSHLIASTLNRLTDIPWIADFRDPMVIPDYPIPAKTMSVRDQIERRTIKQAHTCVFVTQSSLEAYSSKYMEGQRGRFELIPNGYDEEAFTEAGDPSIHSEAMLDGQRKVRLVHSGLLYQRGRNPRSFFKSLANLLRKGRISRNDLKIVLRASSHDLEYKAMVREHGLDGIIEIAPILSRPEALAEQRCADGLLLFQGAEFNTQVPAKLYEYFRSGKPILALVDPAGETADIVVREKAGIVVDMNDVSANEQGLLDFLDTIRNRTFIPLEGEALKKYSRRVGARKFVSLVDSIVSQK